MKFLAAFVLSLSLLVSSSFAVSLTPPMVLKMQEDHTMAASEDINTNVDYTPVKILIGASLISLIASGLIFTIVGFSAIKDEDFNSDIAIGGGVGMIGLGALGMYWAF